MERNIRLIGYTSIVRAAGLSLILPFVALYLRNVLGLGFLQIGFLIAVLGILPLALVPFGGMFADRLGRRRLILVSLFVEAVSIFLGGVAMLAHSLGGVVGAALAVNLAGSMGGPAQSAYVADLAVGSDRTAGYTYIRIGWNLGFTFGVFSGGVLVGALGFAPVGLFAGLVLVVGSTLLALYLAPSPYDRQRPDAAARTAPGIHRQPGLGVSLRLLVEDRVFLALCAAVAVGELSVGQWATTFPLYVNSVLHIPYAVLGVGLALNGVLVVVAQAPTTRAAVGRRHTALLELGLVLYVAGFLVLGFVALVPALLVGGFFASVFVLTMGENVFSIPTTTLPSNLAPPTEIGAYNGAFFAILGVGQILAPTLGGLVLAFGLSPPVTWALLMLPSVPALLLLRAWILPRVPDRPNRA